MNSQRISTDVMPHPFPGPCVAKDGDSRAYTGGMLLRVQEKDAASHQPQVFILPDALRVIATTLVSDHAAGLFEGAHRLPMKQRAPHKNAAEFKVSPFCDGAPAINE